MKRLLPLLLLLLTAGRLLAQTTTLTGTVRDATGQPLPGVNVFLKTTFDGASTDTLGRFRFTTTQTGTLLLVASLLGYVAQEQPVTLAGTAQQRTFRLKAVRNQLGDVVVTAGTYEAGDDKRNTTFSARDVQTTAGAQADVAGALNTLPGTTRNGEAGQLFVRGGAASETKQYLDGLPLQSAYNAAPSGVPARGRFAPTLFKGTMFSTGGYSAEYGQALSAVVALRSVDLAEETQTGISALSLGGLTLARQQRWERSSVAVTADYMNMRPYFGLVPQRILRTMQAASGSVAARQRTGEMGMLKLYGTVQQQHTAVLTPSADYPTGQQPIDLRNTNAYLNASWRTPLARGWSLQTGAATTHDNQRIRPDQQRIQELEQSVVGRAVVTNDSASVYWNLKLGTEVLVQRYRFHYQASESSLIRTLAFSEQRTAGFAESEIAFSNKVAGRVGGRAEYSAILGRWNAAPRAALAYQINSNSQLSGAWGYFYQTPTNDALRLGQYAPEPLRFERARHYQFTYQYEAHQRLLRLEAYDKRYANLVRYDLPGTLNPTTVMYQLPSPATYRSTGTGYARGLDVLWRDKTTVRNFDYWVSYSLLDTRRQQRFDPVQAVPTYAARHNVAVVGKYWVDKWHTLFGATYSYGSSRAYFDPNRYDAATGAGYNAGRLPSFQDLSVNLSYLTQIRKNFTIVHVSCSNVLGRQNVFGYRYASMPDAATGRYTAVPLLPSARRMVFVYLLISINKNRPVDLHTAPED